MRARIALASSDRGKNAECWQESECLGGRAMILRWFGDGVPVQIGNAADQLSTLEAESE